MESDEAVRDVVDQVFAAAKADNLPVRQDNGKVDVELTFIKAAATILKFSTTSDDSGHPAPRFLLAADKPPREKRAVPASKRLYRGYEAEDWNRAVMTLPHFINYRTNVKFHAAGGKPKAKKIPDLPWHQEETKKAISMEVGNVTAEDKLWASLYKRRTTFCHVVRNWQARAIRRHTKNMDNEGFAELDEDMNARLRFLDCVNRSWNIAEERRSAASKGEYLHYATLNLVHLEVLVHSLMQDRSADHIYPQHEFAVHPAMLTQAQLVGFHANAERFAQFLGATLNSGEGSTESHLAGQQQELLLTDTRTSEAMMSWSGLEAMNAQAPAQVDWSLVLGAFGQVDTDPETIRINPKAKFPLFPHQLVGKSSPCRSPAMFVRGSGFVTVLARPGSFSFAMVVTTPEPSCDGPHKILQS
jgi:hypothetical protein